MSASGKAKYWLTPEIELARNQNLTGVQLKEIREYYREPLR
jgi:hypothetical protein